MLQSSSFLLKSQLILNSQTSLASQGFSKTTTSLEFDGRLEEIPHPLDFTNPSKISFCPGLAVVTGESRDQIIGDRESTTVIALAKKTVEELFLEYNSLYGKGSRSECASSSAIVDDPYAQGWLHAMELNQKNKLN